MEQKKKETVGKIAMDLQKKTGENRDVIAQRNAMLSDWDKHFNKAFERGKKQFGGDFYVFVITKRERLLTNVVRHYWAVGEVCPTPMYDQSVYHCRRKEKEIDLLWTVPCKDAVDRMTARPDLEPLDRVDLLRCALAFSDGSLLRKCMLLNGEIKESTESDSFDPSKLDQENLIIQH